jgi:NAD(P)-dependent dehydrogenase (short-subunit alcohol dehydrogenase family)
MEQMGDRLKDRVAVVTGSGQGIGRAIAIALAGEGARVVTNNRQPAAAGGDAETTAREIANMGGQAVPFFGDISKFEVAQKLMQTAVDEFGRLDILVSNAGGTDAHGMVWQMTEAEWDATISIHLKGSFNCIRHASGLMKEQRWGRIINATSTAWLGSAEWCNYNAAMAGVVGLTRAVARDIGQYGVTCNAYAPIAATRRLVTEDKKARFKRVYEAGLMTREQYEELVDPPGSETVAPLIVYLCTDEAADINGQVFNVTGGDIALYSAPIRKKAILKEEGLWTVEELIELVPRTLLEGYQNPAPARSPE